MAAAPEQLRSYYSQQIDWKPCEGSFQCAKIKVPLDYSKPDGERIELAAIKLATTGDKKGTLMVNPGGPGGSGYDFVRDAANTNISDKVRSAYDIVGFDPRGVKRSAPVTCLTDKERDASRAKTYALDTDAGLDEALADNKAIAAKCVEKTGPVLMEHPAGTPGGLDVGGAAGYDGTEAQHLRVATAFDILPVAADPTSDSA